jgi:hypothetical protein
LGGLKESLSINNNNNNNNRGMKDCKALLPLPKHIEVIEKDPKSSLIPHFFFLNSNVYFFLVIFYFRYLEV